LLVEIRACGELLTEGLQPVAPFEQCPKLLGDVLGIADGPVAVVAVCGVSLVEARAGLGECGVPLLCSDAGARRVLTSTGSDVASPVSDLVGQPNRPPGSGGLAVDGGLGVVVACFDRFALAISVRVGPVTRVR
jgi:hypothetical protein